jgi:predicted methyltransferase
MRRSRPPVYPSWLAPLLAGAALSIAACSPASTPEPSTPASAESASVEPESSPSGDASATDTAPPDTANPDAATSDWADATDADPGAAAPPSEPNATSSASGGAEASEGMISFFEIGRGDRVADLGGLFGYSLEPILDAVGGSGVVYARLRPGLSPDAVPYANPDRSHQGELIWMKTPLTAPFGPDAKRLNAVTLLYAYHSIVAANQDRKAFNESVLRALVPGGTYIIVDHAAPPGSGVAAAARMNRIEDHIVRAEVEAAGFKFVEAADFVLDAPRTPDQPAPSQYVLKFKKPR